MFWLIDLKRDVVLQAHEMLPNGKHIRALALHLINDLKQLKCTEEHGFYVSPTKIHQIGDGRIRSLTGAVAFNVHFECLVFMLGEGQVVDALVTKISKAGFEAQCGPFDGIFVHVKKMTDFRFDHTDTSFKGTDGSCITEGCVVRTRIIAIKWIEKERVHKALGTLDGHYLGISPFEDATVEKDEENGDQI